MKTYTENELKEAIKYAMQYQKAMDYQTAGRILLGGDKPSTDEMIALLDELATDTVNENDIELDDIFETKIES